MRFPLYVGLKSRGRTGSNGRSIPRPDGAERAGSIAHPRMPHPLSPPLQTIERKGVSWNWRIAVVVQHMGLRQFSGSLTIAESPRQ